MRWVGGVDTRVCHDPSRIKHRRPALLYDRDYDFLLRVMDVRCLCPVDGGFSTTLWQFAEFKSYKDARRRGYGYG
jgi:hypothetical protein